MAQTDLLVVDLTKVNPASVLKMLVEERIPESRRVDDWEQRWQEMIDYCEQPVDASSLTSPSNQ